MSPPAESATVGCDERLARFIFQRSYLNADGTPKLNPFLPDSRLELSVTRHLLLTEADLWRIGQMVGAVSGRTLRARADVGASAFVAQKLRVLADPDERNPNHANVVDWPLDKPSQKTIAQEIADAAGRAIFSPDI